MLTKIILSLIILAICKIGYIKLSKTETANMTYYQYIIAALLLAELILIPILTIVLIWI